MLKTTTAGNFEFTITAQSDPLSPSQTVNCATAVWSPFNDVAAMQAQCGNLPLPIACEFDQFFTIQPSQTKTISIPGVVANKVYLVMIGNNPNDFGTLTIEATTNNTANTDCSGTPLPVELVTFSGDAIDLGNHLKWQTVSERNNDYFTIYKSTNGYDWSELSTVNGAGNSTNLIDYELIDREASLGVTYYKLRQTDIDGKHQTFNQISVNRISRQELTVYPNPSSGLFDVRYNSSVNQSVSIYAHDVLGALVYQQEVFLKKGMNKIPINLKQTHKGVYFLSIKTIKRES